MISQPTNRVRRLSESTRTQHAERKETDEGKETRVHRLNRRHQRGCARPLERLHHAAAGLPGHDPQQAGRSCDSRCCRRRSSARSRRQRTGPQPPNGSTKTPTFSQVSAVGIQLMDAANGISPEFMLPQGRGRRPPWRRPTKERPHPPRVRDSTALLRLVHKHDQEEGQNRRQWNQPDQGLGRHEASGLCTFDEFRQPHDNGAARRHPASTISSCQDRRQ